MGSPVRATAYAKSKGWLPEVRCTALGWAPDYIGWLGYPITGVAFHNGFSTTAYDNNQMYAAKSKGRATWWPQVIWYNRGDANNGMAGDLVNPLVGFEFHVGAGAPGKPMMKLHLLGDASTTWFPPQAGAAVKNSVLNCAASVKVGWESNRDIDGIWFGLQPW